MLASANGRLLIYALDILRFIVIKTSRIRHLKQDTIYKQDRVIKKACYFSELDT